MPRIFGTDGVRGLANTPPLTAETALQIGRAVAYVCRKTTRCRTSVIIGKDTRLSGYLLETSLTAGICSMGGDALLLGPMPTPGIAFITRSMRADAGVVISASHNPYQDNGIKVFSGEGLKFSDAMEKEIEDLIETGRINHIRPTADDVGKAYRIDDALGRYVVFCKNTFPENICIEGMKIVLDCANGATYKAAPTVFRELGADVITIHDKPNGRNINDNCGSQFTSDLAKAVRQNKAEIGLAFDGDGDRLICVDERGREMNGDHIMYACAKSLLAKNLLENKTVVLTPMSNLGLLQALNKLGINYLLADVGDRQVLELMKKSGAIFGGEQSGHFIFRKLHTTGDGILSALQVVAAIKESGMPTSHLSRGLRIFPQRLVNIDIKKKIPLEKIKPYQTALKSVQAKLGKDGRIFVRYSGTQPLCRVMVEAKTRKMVDSAANALAAPLKRALA